MLTKQQQEAKRKFLLLQAKWYAKLRKSGFVDIECGIDTNQLSTQTFQRSGGSLPVLLWDFERQDKDGDNYLDWDGVSNFTDTDKFEFYRRIADFAYSLPIKDRRRKVLIAVIDHNQTGAAKMLKMTTGAVNDIWTETVRQLGMKVTPKTKQEKAAPPAPVRSLSKTEINRLGYAPPKAIKDKTLV